jgi:hypothetical protein
MEEKACARCDNYFAIDSFPRNGGGRRSPYCIECKKKYDKEYWAKTKSRRNDRKKSNIKTTRERNRDYINNYLRNHPCIDCGNNEIVVLEFDHRSGKDYNISDMLGFSIELIQEEMEKCDIRCANCHRKKTALERGWL